jgi:hypothetical protein
MHAQMNDQMITGASRGEEEKDDGKANNSRRARKCIGLIDARGPR